MIYFVDLVGKLARVGINSFLVKMWEKIAIIISSLFNSLIFFLFYIYIFMIIRTSTLTFNVFSSLNQFYRTQLVFTRLPKNSRFSGYVWWKTVFLCIIGEM